MNGGEPSAGSGSPPVSGLRFVDILTTASAVANYLGQGDVSPEHLLHAIAIQRGVATLDDLGRPSSPFAARAARGGIASGVDPAVQELVQRWYTRLGSEPTASIDSAQVDAFASELRALAGDAGAGASAS